MVSKLPFASQNGHLDLQLKMLVQKREETINYQQNKGLSPNFDSNIKQI